MALLIQFLLRLAFGLTLGMSLVSSRETPSGYFRNHLYVVLGLCVLAALLCHAVAPAAMPFALAGSALSYFAAACWLYEMPRAGKLTLALAGAAALAGALTALPGAVEPAAAAIHDTGSSLSAYGQQSWALRYVQVVSSGTLLGVTLAAMLLGHWYLNSPGMQLKPLERLLTAMFAAVALQIAVSLLGMALLLACNQFQGNLQWGLFVALRWLFGLVGVVILTWMARQTLRIPNTQSATGILYVAVIGTFVGELMSMLLGVESPWPI